jgi:predicted ABC-type ATPase
MLSKPRIKKLRIFAGPNGSGKTTLINEIRSSFSFGKYINADEILASFQQKKFLDYSFILQEKISIQEWRQFLKTQSRIISTNLEKLRISDYFIYTDNPLDGYDASVIADFFREKLLFEEQNFSFETVMSHYSKIEFMKKARLYGFKIYYYFVCTSDPEINVKRVENRVQQGGHDVDTEKIKSRYNKCLQLLHDAFLTADRAFVMDTTYGDAQVIVEKNGVDVDVLGGEVPEWVEEYLLKKLR